MDRNYIKTNNQNKHPINVESFFPQKTIFFVSIIILIILSLIKLSLKSDKLNSKIWTLAIEVNVTSVTLILVFILWLPIALPWIISLFPQIQGSLNWLRKQGIEEVQTNILRIKLRYGVQEAAENYEEKILKGNSGNLDSQETSEQIERYYRDAIKLANTASDIEPEAALKRIDQLADYYDEVREKLPPGRNRTKLMREISATMWTLIPGISNFPIYEKLSSHKGGERLSAYKYLEWNPSIEYINLLLSRAIGILELPFSQYAALLALRRVVTNNKLSLTQSQEIIYILNWSSTIDYIKEDRQKLIVAIISLIELQRST